jgi:hypothetical protein
MPPGPEPGRLKKRTFPQREHVRISSGPESASYGPQWCLPKRQSKRSLRIPMGRFSHVGCGVVAQRNAHATVRARFRG